MSLTIAERRFEEAIEYGLLQHGQAVGVGDAPAIRETAPPYGDTLPGSYRKRQSQDYDRTLCRLPRDVVDFVPATFELYKRITDDRAFGEALKHFLFDQCLRAHRNAGR
jgi:hypothetical protein